MSPRKTAVPVSPPIVFVHGMWLSAASWQNWIDLFAASGFDAVAPLWPGEHPTAEQTRAHPDDVAGVGMQQLINSYADLIREMPVPPILIGHSLGGTVVQKLLAAGYGAGGVLIDSARFDGELPGALETLRVALPAMADRASIGSSISLTDYQFRFAFGRSIDAEESGMLFEEYAIPAPARLLFEPETANIVLPAAAGRKTKPAAPLLALDGAPARATGGSMVGAMHKIYDAQDSITESAQFADRGSSLVIDSGWQSVAERVLDWVQERFGTAAGKPAAGSGARAVALRGTAA
jgi:non-heme chloroperoxidase